MNALVRILLSWSAVAAFALISMGQAQAEEFQGTYYWVNGSCFMIVGEEAIQLSSDENFRCQKTMWVNGRCMIVDQEQNAITEVAKDKQYLCNRGY